MTFEQSKIEKTPEVKEEGKTEKEREEKEWDISEIPIPGKEVKEYLENDLEWIQNMRETIARVIKRDIEKTLKMKEEGSEAFEEEKKELDELIKSVEEGRDYELGKFLREKFKEAFK